MSCREVLIQATKDSTAPVLATVMSVLRHAFLLFLLPVLPGFLPAARVTVAIFQSSFHVAGLGKNVVIRAGKQARLCLWRVGRHRARHCGRVSAYGSRPFG